MTTSPTFVSVPKNPTVSFVNADGTTFKTLMSAGTNGSRIDTVFASNTDTSNAYVLQLAIQKSGVDYVIGEVNVPLGAGTNGSTKSVAVLNTTDLPGLAYVETGSLYLENGATLRARVKTAAAGGNSVQLVGIGGDY